MSDILCMQLFALHVKAEHIKFFQIYCITNWSWNSLPIYHMFWETLQKARLRWYSTVWHLTEGTHLLLKYCEPIPKAFLHRHKIGCLVTHGTQLVPHLRWSHPDDEVVSAEELFLYYGQWLTEIRCILMVCVHVCDCVIRITSLPPTWHHSL